MIYTIKFLYQLLLPPTIFICIILGLGIYLFRYNKKLAIAILLTAIAFYLTSTNFGRSLLVGSLESMYTQPHVVAGDVVVVLNGDNNRIVVGSKLARSKNLPIIVAGGRVYPSEPDNSPFILKTALSAGLHRDNIYLETDSINTTQSVRYLQSILRDKGFDKPILVTSAQHMPRSMLICRQNNITTQPYPMGYTINRSRHYTAMDFVPRGWYMDVSANAVKEFLGIVGLYLGYGRL